MYYIDWFVDIKESLHSWDKAHLVMVYVNCISTKLEIILSTDIEFFGILPIKWSRPYNSVLQENDKLCTVSNYLLSTPQLKWNILSTHYKILISEKKKENKETGKKHLGESEENTKLKVIKGLRERSY